MTERYFAFSPDIFKENDEARTGKAAFSLDEVSGVGHAVHCVTGTTNKYQR